LTWPAPTCSTASGCAASAAAVKPARSPRSYTSARRPLPTTCGRCSPRSASAPAASSPRRFPQNQTEPAGQVAGLRAYRAVVPGGVGYHDDYQVAGDDYPRMRMQPNDRLRSVIIIFEMKPMSLALWRKLPGPGVFGANSPDSETAVLPCDTRAGAASSTALRRC
jgi:hypothetical protein